MELASAIGTSPGPTEGGAAVLPLFSQVCRHVASWIVVPELSWDLRSVFVPSVCYHSGNWEFLELGVMLLFHVGCFWLPVLEKSLNVAYILRELVVPHRPSPRRGPS